MKKPVVYIALPMLDEDPSCPLVKAILAASDDVDIRLWVLVNQPDAWWDDPKKKARCLRNQDTLNTLKTIQDTRLTVMDRSSPGLGWGPKKAGIGMARKVLLDAITQNADPDAILLSVDADSQYPPGYFEMLLSLFNERPDAVGWSLPYYHPLCGDEAIDRAMLRYELYMRCYLRHLFRIGTPYVFTALGSAMATKVKHYRAIGGLTPKKGGEDFYFLQKLRKYGPVLLSAPLVMTPGTRLSDRVGFGTGPALIKGVAGNWQSYPIYHTAWFQAIQDTIALFPALYTENRPTPMDAFIQDRMGDASPWEPLRANASTQAQFIKFCHEKIDGLRLLQFLHDQKAADTCGTDEAYFRLFWQEYAEGSCPLEDTHHFETAPLSGLIQCRDQLFEKEQDLRANYDQHA